MENRVRKNILSGCESKELAKLLSNEILEYVDKNKLKNQNYRLVVDNELLKDLLGDLLFLNEENSILRYIDLSKVSFEGELLIKCNLEGTNANVDPQLIENKDLRNANLKGLDMQDKDFTGVNIEGANLEDTNAFIDVATIKYGNIYRSKLKGCVVTNVPDIYLDKDELKGATIEESYCEAARIYIKSLFK